MATREKKSSRTPFLVAGGFARQLCRHGVLIECRCVHCGFRFIGSVSHKLQVMERIHTSKCSKKRPQDVAFNHLASEFRLKALKAHA